MLKTRIIPVLLLKNGVLVRSRNFTFHQSTGNHIYQVERFSEWKADEIIYLDISRESSHCTDTGVNVIGSTSSNISKNGNKDHDIISVINKISKVCRVPLTIGGGIKSLEDIRKRLAAGADKVSINTIAIDNPSFIATSAEKFGSQCIVVSIDVKKENGTWMVYKNFGQNSTNLIIDDWIATVASLGAGEILLQSIDQDGRGDGYDLELVKHVEKMVEIPIVILGGVGDFTHLLDGHKVSNHVALAAGNIFHFTERSIVNAKKFLLKSGVNVRI